MRERRNDAIVVPDGRGRIARGLGKFPTKFLYRVVIGSPMFLMTTVVLLKWAEISSVPPNTSTYGASC